MTQTTILELAELADVAYGGASARRVVTQDNWQVLRDSTGQPLTGASNDGTYFGIAYKNTITNEIVIANRGTRPTHFSDLWNDAKLATNHQTPAADAAIAFAKRVALLNPGATIIETGHSLGGYEAQAGLAAIIDGGLSATASAVVFNAPGLTDAYFTNHTTPQSYPVLDLYNQGDIIHAAGGTRLGVSAVLTAGPSPLAEFGHFAAGFLLGAVVNPLIGLGLGGGRLAADLGGVAHSIGTAISDLETGIDSLSGSMTREAFVTAGHGFTPSPLVTANGDGSVTLSNGTGSSVTLQAPANNVVGDTATVGGDGALAPAANVGATNAELAADGPGTVNEQVPAATIDSLSGGSSNYVTLSPSANGNGAVLGSSPPGESTGLLGQASGSDAAPGGRFDFNVPAGGQIGAETIYGGSGQGTVWVGGAAGYNQLLGAKPLAGTLDAWRDSSGTLYIFSGSPASEIGTLSISGGVLGSNPTNSITIQNFNLSAAQGPTGYMGITLPGILSLNNGANAGGSTPPAAFVEGSTRSYTLSVEAPSTAAQTISVSLSGASATDFEALVGDSLEQLAANGSFNVTLAAGQTNVSFAVIDVTSRNGTDDIGNGTALQLAASVPDRSNLSGPAISATPLPITYTITPSDSRAAPNPTNNITGVYNSGLGATVYTGDGGNDNVAAGPGPNYISLFNSRDDSIIAGNGPNTIMGGTGTDIISLVGGQNLVQTGGGFDTVYGGTGKDTIRGYLASAEDPPAYGDVIICNGGTDAVFAGDGINEIDAGTKTNLTDAITAGRTAASTGLPGDLIAVGDGDNTVIGSNGNDLIATDDSFSDGSGGRSVVVLGGGNDTFLGANNSQYLDGGVIPYAGNPYPQPYNGNYQSGGQPVGSSGATVFGGTGNDLIELANGNNYVEMGSGNSSVYGGMGNDVIIADAGADYVHGGGGTTYIQGGSGSDTLFGGDGSNTIIGGSGNSTIHAASGPDGTINFPNANQDHNYVTGGSGNDAIYGSAGQDTLIAGTGNTTIYGQKGNEYIVGGAGNDLLEGGSGNNTIVASGAGNDSLYANASSSSVSFLYGGTGRDLIKGGGGTNVLYAGDGGAAGAATSVIASQSDSTAFSTIYGGLGIDYLQGGNGSSVIFAGNGGTASAPTTVVAGSGNTTLYGGLGTDVIYGGSGLNVLFSGNGGTAAAPTTVNAGSGIATLYGGAGASRLQDGLSGNDLLISGGSNDTLSGIGADTLVAGTGNDLLQANSGAVNFQFNPGFGADTILSNGGRANLLFSDGVSSENFGGSIGIDSLGHNYLTFADDTGESITIRDGLSGVLASAVNIDPSSIPLQTLLTDALGGDQTIASGSNNLIVSLADGEAVTAGAHQDTISSWGLSATLTGGSAGIGDVIYSTGSGAKITSASGNDSVNSLGTNASVTGGSTTDHITVSGANSRVTSSSRGDFITASGSNDTLVAPSGNTQFFVNDSSTVIQVSGASATDVVNASVNYTAPTNVNALTLTGSANITATGNAGADTLTGGAGNDTLTAGAGLATLIGGTGNTTFVVNNTADVVQEASTSTTNTLVTPFSTTLGANLQILMLTGTVALTGTANSANDTLVSNGGVDTLIGGSGNDTFVIHNSADIIQDAYATSNNVAQSSVSYSLRSNVNTLMLTGTAALTGTANSANDTLISNSGVDTLVGGAGNDTFVINNGLDAIVAGTGSNSVLSGVSYTTPTAVTTLTLTGTAALTATGNSAANTITANSGDDTLIAGSGPATLVGGAGNDTFVINSSADAVVNASVTSNATLISSISVALPTNVNTLLLTGTTPLVGTANSASDTLIAGTAVSTLIGGTGSDVFVINSANDVVQVSSLAVDDTIISSVSYTLPVNVNTLVLSGTANLAASGNGAADLIVANSGNDTLTAIGGYNVTLRGGAGNDLFIVNNSQDVVQPGTVHGVDTISAAASFSAPDNIAYLVLTGTSTLTGTLGSTNAVLIGNGGNDTLRTGTGVATVYAGVGNATIVDTNYLGSNQLIAGSGNDTIFASGADTVVAGTGTSYVYSGAASTATLTLVMNNGFGQLHQINNQPDNLVFGAGITPGSLAVTAAYDSVGGSFDLKISSGASTLTVDNGFLPGRIGTVSFVGGSTLTFAQLLAQAQVTPTSVTNSGSTLTFSTANAASITGGSGQETIVAWGNNDTLIAGTSTSEVLYGAGNNTVLYGGASSGSFYAYGAADTLISGAGGGYFFVNGPSEVVVDAVGANAVVESTVSYSLPANVDTLHLLGTAALVATGNSDASSIEIDGNSGNDTLQAGAGSSASSNLSINSGSAGNQVLIGGNGSTTLQTWSVGNTTMIAGAGPTYEYQNIGTGDVLFIVNSSSDRVSGQAGANDTLQSSVSFTVPVGINTILLTGSADLAITATANTGNEYITANSGNDSIVAGNGSNTIVGGNGNDTLVSGQGASTLSAGSGNDLFVIGNAADVVSVGALHGNDTIQYTAGGGNFTLLPYIDSLLISSTGGVRATGNADNDVISSYGNNTLVAGSGADTLSSYGYFGADTLIGGAGNDVFAVNLAGTVVQDAYANTGSSVQSSIAFTLPANVNAMVLTGSNALVGTGNSANDVITANSGNDTLVSGVGVDTLIGGAGNDLYILNNPGDAILNLSAGANTIEASFSYVLPTNANTLILTGTAALSGAANSANDTLISNSGVDTLTGGTGNDFFIINNPGDVVVDSSSTSTNVISSSVSTSLPTNVNRLILTGTSALVGTANGANDTLTANSGADTLISAATGADSLVGGAGNDLFIVNSTSDVVNVGSTHGVDTIQASVSFNASTNVANLVFTGSANVAGTGNSLANVIIANGGVDTLTAGSGLGTLVGGSGNDTFVINNVGDVIVDSSSSASNTLRSSVTYSLPTNINSLILTGTAALMGTANGGTDTLQSNSGVDTLVGGAGTDVFIVSNTADVIQESLANTNSSIRASVNFTLPTNVNSLTLTGTAALIAAGNSANDLLVANSGADTLIAGNGNDTSISGTGSAAQSLVGGTGTDLFIVNLAGDIVTVGSTHGSDTIQAAVSYTAAANVANLTLTGTANLSGTGNSIADVITANSGNDTLTAGSGVATLVGGSGNDTFVVNNVADVVVDTSATASNVLSSSVSYSLPTNVNRLILTGTAALVGTANSANDTLTANSGADTLISGSGIDSLVAGTGNDLFIVNNAADIVSVGATHGVDTIRSSVSFTASVNVTNLTLTGTAALTATGNSLADIITANSGADTLIAGSGLATLVAGAGTDTFVVNNAADVILGVAAASPDTVVSSASYTLPTNLSYLTLSGTAALVGTGNGSTDLIVANSGNDTLVGGTGIAVLEGGITGGSDQIKALSNQAALMAGKGSSTLTGGAFKDFLAAGSISDNITTGATVNVIAVNKGDGATTLQPTTGASNILSLGAGIDTENLHFTKTANNLVLTDGVSGDSVTLANWYASTNNQTVSELQVVEIASSSYNSIGADSLRNQALEEFNFTSLVTAFNGAGSPANWALSTAMPSAQLASSPTAAYGGDLAYYFGLNGNLTGMNLSAAQSTLTNASFGTATQTIDAFSSISGGGGVHLAVVKPGTSVAAAVPEAAIASPENPTPAAPDSASVETASARRYVDPINVGWLAINAMKAQAISVGEGGTESAPSPVDALFYAAVLGEGQANRVRRSLWGVEIAAGGAHCKSFLA